MSQDGTNKSSWALIVSAFVLALGFVAGMYIYGSYNRYTFIKGGALRGDRLTGEVAVFQAKSISYISKWEEKPRLEPVDKKSQPVTRPPKDLLKDLVKEK